MTTAPSTSSSAPPARIQSIAYLHNPAPAVQRSSLEYNVWKLFALNTATNAVNTCFRTPNQCDVGHSAHDEITFFRFRALYREHARESGVKNMPRTNSQPFSKWSVNLEDIILGVPTDYMGQSIPTTLHRNDFYPGSSITQSYL